MAIEKKSLIGNRASVKKAIIASQPTETSESIGGSKAMKVESLRAKKQTFNTLKKK